MIKKLAGSPASGTKDENCANNNSNSNNNSLIAHITNLPGFDSSKARIVKQGFSSNYDRRGSSSVSGGGGRSQVCTPVLPTAAETFLPWRRDRSYQNFGTFMYLTLCHKKKSFLYHCSIFFLYICSTCFSYKVL